MTANDRDGTTRHKVLGCMGWAGTGVLWGLPAACRARSAWSRGDGAAAPGLTFLQISDSHMGFDKPANPNAHGTLEEAVGRIGAAGEAVLHDPHRRHQASVEAGRVRRR